MISDESDGGGKPSAMEIVQNFCQQKNISDKILNHTSTQNKQQKELPEKIVEETNSEYLHKKFKRLANPLNDLNSINIPPNNSQTQSSNPPPPLQLTPSTIQLKETSYTKLPSPERDESKLSFEIDKNRLIKVEPFQQISSVKYLQGQQTEFHPTNHVLYNNNLISNLKVEDNIKIVPNVVKVVTNNNINDFHESRIKYLNGDERESSILLKPPVHFNSHNNQSNHSSNVIYVSQSTASPTLSLSQSTTHQSSSHPLNLEQLQYNSITFIPNPQSISSSSSSSPPIIDYHFAAVSPTTSSSSSIALSNSTSTASLSTSGRHVCPFCHLNCTKPSVLQKHIRSHTNERPYPCGPCGCAFKTKSNLYKHQR